VPQPGDDAGRNGPRWGYAPSPLRGWGDPHPLAGESWAIGHVVRWTATRPNVAAHKVTIW
jgi:hypothetical protein